MTSPSSDQPLDTPRPRWGRIRLRRVIFLGLVAVLVVLVVGLGRLGVTWATQLRRTTPVFDPPVLAGMPVTGLCSGGVYARTADDLIVITTTGHCGPEGHPAVIPGDGRFVGRLSAPSNWPRCDRPGKDRCTSSDMAYVPVVPAMIPWGHLDQVDLGAGGYRTITPGTRALRCDQVRAGDRVEINGRSVYRTGKVIGQQANDFPQDGTYFPCITVADIEVGAGDSGGIVLVNGAPAGVTSRAYGGYLGFTPLAEGLEEMGLTLCDTPDCGLTPSTAANRGLVTTP